MNTVPTIALDFDGVLNVDGFNPGAKRFTVSLPAGGNDTPWFSLLPENVDVDVDVDYINGLINDWRSMGANVVWGSLWHGHTAAYLNPILGFDMQNGFDGVSVPHNYKNRPIDWKKYALRKKFSGPILLVDDSVETKLFTTDVDTLGVDSSVGISSVVAMVNSWLDTHTS